MSCAAFKVCFKLHNNCKKLYKEIICGIDYFLVWCRTQLNLFGKLDAKEVSAIDLMLAEFRKSNSIHLPRKLLIHLEKNETYQNYNVNKKINEGDMTTALGGRVLSGRKINSGVFPVLVWKQG